jgi:hypothetical protein
MYGHAIFTFVDGIFLVTRALSARASRMHARDLVLEIRIAAAYTNSPRGARRIASRSPSAVSTAQTRIVCERF